MDSIIPRTRASVDDLLAIEKKLASGKSNFYTYDDALKKLLEGSVQIHGCESVTVEAAKILLKRGLKKVSETENKWEFTRDLKHRTASLYGYPQEVYRKMASEVKCPHLLIRSIDGRSYETGMRVLTARGSL